MGNYFLTQTFKLLHGLFTHSQKYIFPCKTSLVAFRRCEKLGNVG